MVVFTNIVTLLVNTLRCLQMSATKNGSDGLSDRLKVTEIANSKHVAIVCLVTRIVRPCRPKHQVFTKRLAAILLAYFANPNGKEESLLLFNIVRNDTAT